jgi:hypothetical protein
LSIENRGVYAKRRQILDIVSGNNRAPRFLYS